MTSYRLVKLDDSVQYETVVEYAKHGQIIQGIQGVFNIADGNIGENVLLQVQEGQHYYIETLEQTTSDGATVEILHHGLGEQTILYSVAGGEVVPLDEVTSEPPPLYYPALEEQQQYEAPKEAPKPQRNVGINVVCKICTQDFLGVEEFNEHMKTHQEVPAEEKQNAMIIAGEVPLGATKVEMVDLAATSNNAKTIYSCAFCNKRYIWHKFLVTHSKSHKTVSPFKCTICGESFECLYYEHMKTHIVGDSGRECGKCEIAFGTLKAYKSHLKLVHQGDSPNDSIIRKHKCPTCGKHYKALSYLREHQRVHTGEKPYTCELCGKGFSKYGCFSEHKKTHNIIQAFKCPMCTKAFTKRRYLKAHLLRHPKTVDLDKIFVEDFDGEVPARKFLFGPNRPNPTAPKPQQKLECPICFKEFKKLRYLKGHIARHPDEFIRRRLRIDPNVPIPALISCGSFNANNLLQNSKNSLINFQSSINNSKKEEFTSSDESSSEDEQESVVNDDNWQNDDNSPTFETSSREELLDEKLNIELPVERVSFNCSTCSKIFPTDFELNEHELVHTGEQPLKCRYCNIYFASQSRFEQHLKEDHHLRKRRAYDFDECKIEQTHVSTDKMHFTCQMCGTTFYTESLLEEHELLHKTEEPLKCTHCMEIFIVESEFYGHLKSHKVDVVPEETVLEAETEAGIIPEEDVPEVEIRVLRNRRMNRKSLPLNPRKKKVVVPPPKSPTPPPVPVPVPKKQRTKSKPPATVPTRKTTRIPKPSRKLTTEEKKRFKCKLCSKMYTTQFYLREHLQIHTGARPHKCATCGKTFSTISCYREHIELHVTKKSYKCNLCGMSFAVARYLRAHMHRHTMKTLPDGGKRFECEQCNKKYQSKTALAEHGKIHTGEAPFICPYCSKSFMLTTSYRDHMLKHENVEMHQCPFCPKSFIKARYLQQHIVRHIQKLDTEVAAAPHVQGGSQADTEAHEELPSKVKVLTLVPSADGQSLVPSSEIF